ncbi:Hemolysin secretion protein D%2C chromosomal [Achromobacter xylosoxidans]|jgi:hemolysin D|uniref:HlyD family type I secretion periplasmic adaptor subunit n=1 Tax=Alcaligenes xylosoxydans xylosoxydans TaxID=85698 RepID=UPI00066849D9|nr:HlyD family type I secretion periplasmic adaptor subunit [Achromobacter xylosoxidans]CUI54483.1 Hemolysin secretion protein D%2C chromosomal [Achromobacter xylosoxidans]
MAIGHAVGAWVDLCKRYAIVFMAAWRERKSWNGKRYRSEEAEFLPAALSLQQRAVSPAPRVAMWLLITFAMLALLWSVVGKVDIVATAAGKIIPSVGTQVVQPIGTATVKAIHVREGQVVRAGDLLIELDDTVSRAEQQRIANELQTWDLQTARAEAMLMAIESGRPPILKGSGAESPAIKDAQRLVEAEFQSLQAKLAGIAAEMLRRQAEYQSTLALARKLERTAPIARQRAESLKELAGDQYVARNTYLERERERIEQESDLLMQRSRLKEIEASIAEARQEQETVRADAKHANLNRLNEGRQRAALLEQDLVKARQAERLTRLTAPVSGTVQQLAVRTLGGVVTEAQPLMLVVPQEHMVEIEAFLENKDVGFVKPGQEAEVKVETFPYTKYGIVPGTVTSVSEDAINDEKRGLVYSMRVSMERTKIAVNGSEIRLAPGMAVTAEIKTGQRRVIEYFLDPLMQYGQESIRER